MKQIKFFLCILVLIVTKPCLYSNDYEYFKHLSTDNIDYLSGEKLFTLYNVESLKNVSEVKCLEIEIKDEQKNQYEKRLYSSGILTERYTITNEETDWNLVYNEKGYLEKTINQRREYPEDNICIVHKNNDKIEKRITLYEDSEKIKVDIEKYSKKEIFYLTKTNEYYYKDNLLQKIQQESYNQKGTKTELLIAIFDYNEFKELLKQKIYINDKLRWDFNYYYDSSGNLTKIEKKDLEDSNNVRTVTFDEFDKKGNWIHANDYFGDTKDCEIIRHIQYND